jgi:hypothetical protein
MTVQTEFGDTAMHPLLMSPLAKWAFMAVGGAMAVHWIVREAQRANARFRQRKAKSTVDHRQIYPHLHRDPRTGVFRPQ